jgi:hypothetical protein
LYRLRMCSCNQGHKFNLAAVFPNSIPFLVYIVYDSSHNSNSRTGCQFFWYLGTVNRISNGHFLDMSPDIEWSGFQMPGPTRLVQFSNGPLDLFINMSHKKIFYSWQNSLLFTIPKLDE